MRRILLLALLALAPLPAQAYEASVVYNGCNNTQRDQVRAALERVDTSLNLLFLKFDKNELTAEMSAWFGTTPVAKVRERYQRIREMLDRPRTLVLSCEERQCQHDLFGYAQDHAISVCPEFFASKPYEGYDSQAGTLVHEFSHSVASTDDYAYGVGRARALAHDEPLKAARNADNYQYFFEAATNENVKFGTTAWNPANSCEFAYDSECDHPDTGTGSCRAGTDTADCEMAAQDAANSPNRARRPSFGPLEARNTCTTALNGTCDTACEKGTDYTDCLTGMGRSKEAR